RCITRTISRRSYAGVSCSRNVRDLRAAHAAAQIPYGAAARVRSILDGAVQLARGRCGGTLAIPELDREQSARVKRLRTDHDLTEPVIQVVRHLEQVGRCVRDARPHGIVRPATGYRYLSLGIPHEDRDALHLGLGSSVEKNRKASGAGRLGARLDPTVRRARVAVLRVPVVAGLADLYPSVAADCFRRVGAHRELGEEQQREHRKTVMDDDHGAVTAHVTPTSGSPSGSLAVSTVHVKSAAVGGVAPWQSKKLIVNRFPGVSGFAVPARISRSAKSKSLGCDSAPDCTLMIVCRTL